MKFFLDTADTKQIEEVKRMGILDGITTNPTLLYKEHERTGKSIDETMHAICDAVDGPVNLEVTATDASGIIEEGRDLRKYGDNVVVKIPMGKEGIQAVKILSGEKIKTNVTLIFSPLQALLAAKVGATYVCPFIGRLDDISRDGMELVENIINIFDNYEYTTEILVASVRHPMHIFEAGISGADIVTIPFSVIEKLFEHPLTDIGIQKFLDDWNKIKKK